MTEVPAHKPDGPRQFLQRKIFAPFERNMFAYCERTSQHHQQGKERPLDASKDPKQQEEQQQDKKIRKEQAQKTSEPPGLWMQIRCKTTSQVQCSNNDIEQHHCTNRNGFEKITHRLFYRSFLLASFNIFFSASVRLSYPFWLILSRILSILSCVMLGFLTKGALFVWL